MIDWSASVICFDLYTLHHRESFSVGPESPSACPINSVCIIPRIIQATQKEMNY